jgi:hypothetical protein
MEKYCCEDMKISLENPRHCLHFDLSQRRYWVEKKDCRRGIELKFCPWCATPLPKSLRAEYLQALSESLGKKVFWKDIQAGHIAIPTEFHTDEWWKKRGL